MADKVYNGKREASMMILDTLNFLKVVRGNRGTRGMSVSFLPCPTGGPRWILYSKFIMNKKIASLSRRFAVIISIQSCVLLQESQTINFAVQVLWVRGALVDSGTTM